MLLIDVKAWPICSALPTGSDPRYFPSKANEIEAK